MQDALTEDENTGGWAHLPSELLQRIAHLLAAAAGGHAQAETQLRLCCKHWRQSLPLGHSYAAKLWAWEPGAAAALGPHARHIDLMAPLPLPTPRVCPLLRVAHLPLRTLRLRHCAADALPALAELTTLEELDANVHFTGAHANWLAFAGELPGLRSLALRAAVGAVLLTDTGAALLARLPGLARLEVSPSSLGQGGIDRLARALRSLTHVELQLHDGVAPQTLLLRGAEPAPAPAPPAGPAGPAPAAPAPAGGGAPPGSPRRVAAPLASLTAHVSRIKAPGLLEMVVHVAPGIRHLDVRQSGGTFLLAAPPSLLPLAGSLESLSLPGIQLPREVVAELGACTRLRRLGAELHYSVRDDALASWTALAALTNLDLHCNYYLTDAAVAALLAALPRLHDLALAQLQGSGAGLAPLAAMPRLRRLRLESCHLTDAAALAGALASAASLHVLSVQACGVQPDVCQAVAAAAPQLPELGELELVLTRAPAPEAAAALAAACAACAQLTALDLHFCGHSGPAPVAPAWARLEAAARLRHLHAASGLGWGGGALARACAAATGLRSLTLTDNAGVVGDEWLGGLGACTQLSKLNLGSCKGLTPAALGVLRQLSALTSFTAYRCPGLGRPDTVVAALREALPALCLATVHE